MGSRTTHTDLVLEGGGVKGIGLLGAVSTLAQSGYAFDRIAGTSAGAIVGALVAACEAKAIGLDRLEGIMRRIDYPRFRDPTLLPRLGAPGRAVQLALREGLYAGDYLSEWIQTQLDELGVRTFADLRVDGVPPDAPLRNQYRLVVVAADVSRHQVVSLPWDYPKYGLDPDSQLVATAVRASASIPFFFVPVPLHGAGHSGTSTLVDGGLLWNFPLDIFDDPDPMSDTSRTIGIKLSAKVVREPPSSPSEGAVGLAWDCLATLLGSHERYHISNAGGAPRIVFVNTNGMSSIDFDIDETGQDQLYAAGVTAANKWLAAQARAVPAGNGPGARKREAQPS